MNQLTHEKTEELKKLCYEINQSEEGILSSMQKAREFASLAVAEGMMQGQRLIKVRAIIKKRTFEPWLAINCPTLSREQAYRYIRAASKYHDKNTSVAIKTQMEQADTFKLVLELCDKADGVEPKEKKEPPPAYLVGLNKIEALVKFASDHPMKEWPEEGRDEARKLIRPLAEELFAVVE